MNPRREEQAKPLNVNKEDILNHWIENRTPYVSHAVWPTRDALVLESGFVHPAEFMLRLPPYKIEHEMDAFGERGIFDISEGVKELSESNIKIPTHISVINQFVEVSSLVSFGGLTEESYSLLEQKVLEGKVDTIELNDGKTYPIRYSAERNCYVIDNIPDLNYTYLPIGDTIDNIHIQRLMQDILDGNIFDKKLAKIWNAYKQLNKNEVSSLAYLASYLQELRSEEFGGTKINADVRCTFNGINWKYGDIVVVLKGEPSEIISSTWNIERKRSKGKNYFYHEPLLSNQEVGLLQPWENNGEFYSLDLSAENTIIMGPKKKLLPYLNKNYQIFPYEDMTLSQLDFFKVPETLRPNFTVSVVNAYNFFPKYIAVRKVGLQNAVNTYTFGPPDLNESNGTGNASKFLPNQ